MNDENGLALKPYLRWLETSCKSLTVENYRRILVRFCKITGKNFLEIVPDDVTYYLGQLKRKGNLNRTRLHCLKSLKSCYLFLSRYSKSLTLEQQRRAKEVYACLKDKDFVRVKAETNTAPIVLPDETEIKKMIGTATNLRDKVLLALLATTGLRNAELLDVRRSDVDLAGSTINVRAGKGVGKGNARIVDFANGKVKEYLSEFLRTCQAKDDEKIFKISPGQLRKIVRQTAQRAKIKKRVWPHLFRHWCLTELAEKGLPDSLIQLQSGHKSRKMLERYQHLRHNSERYQQANLLGGL